MNDLLKKKEKFIKRLEYRRRSNRIHERNKYCTNQRENKAIDIPHT